MRAPHAVSVHGNEVVNIELVATPGVPSDAAVFRLRGHTAPASQRSRVAALRQEQRSVLNSTHQFPQRPSHVEHACLDDPLQVFEVAK